MMMTDGYAGSLGRVEGPDETINGGVAAEGLRASSHVCPVLRDPILATLEVTPTAIARYGHRMIREAEVCKGAYVEARRTVESQGPSAPPWENQKLSF